MLKKEVKKKSAKIVSILFSFLILGVLIISGPADAFMLSISINKTIARNGDSISFITTINIENNERLPIDKLTLQIIGPETINCEFFPDGTKISGCDFLEIQKINTINYTNGELNGNYSGTNYNWGYGYGYGYGGGIESLSYNITLNTTNMSYGEYSTNFKLKIENDEFLKQGENITIIEPINITDLGFNPSCVYETDNITVMAKITGSVQEVWVETNISGIITNHSTEKDYENYSAIFKGTANEYLYYRFVVKDVLNNITEQSWKQIFIVPRTKLSVFKPQPDGNNGWYVTEPHFTLENQNASKIYYQWDSDDIRLYNGTFGLENIPNSPLKESAGILDLHYFSNTSCGIEEKNQRIFYVDLTKPQFNNLNPENNTIVNVNNLTISSYIDDIYQSNSGINITTIKMKIDGSNVPASINLTGLDAVVNYYTENLTNGWHNVRIYAEDKAGWNNSIHWKFYVNVTTVPEFTITINSPENIITNKKRQQFNLSVSENVEKIEYINYAENRPRWRRLCRNCDEYGLSRKKFKNLREGENNITFKATKGIIHAVKNMRIFIDSKKPRIQKILPRSRKFFNGSEFLIKYTEQNIRNITLYYGNETVNYTDTKLDCNAGKNQICIFNENLTQYNGGFLEYSFWISDDINQKISRTKKVEIDTIPPKINNIEYEVKRKRVRLKINISEEYLKKIEYIDHNSKRPRYKRLCSRLKHGICEKSITFKGEIINMTIRTIDKAGNQDTENFIELNPF